ncbi:MAG: class I tRNA ligase family protein, partial [Acidobacteria bacterium]|nr:class I tRNA ligase family protein [Acidobacteriota bacterium]
PGDFIVEYIGQTRGWFYTLHVLATALFDRPAFSTCVSHGIVLGDDGQKMSKSRRNYPDPMAVFEQHGADAMRWYLLSSSILRGADFSVTEDGIRDTVRQVILPLWNSWYFLSLYARAEGRSGRVRTDSPHRLDRYVLAKTGSLVSDVTGAMDGYDLFGAASSVREFLDVLTNWYIRRSRDRFWSGDQDAIDTLHTVMEALTRLVAPLLPLTAEAVYRGLTGERSVHLADWPVADAFPSDERLVAAMDEVRSVCSATLSLRKAHGRRVRQPLRSLHVATPLADGIGEFEPLIRDEVNVRSVTLSGDVSGVARRELRVVPARLGPRLGAAVQQVIAAVKRGDWTESEGAVTAGGHRLEPGEYELVLAASAGDGTGTVAATLDGGRGIVLLDVALDDDLIAEGAARDLVRVVQQARRTAGLSVSDRIVVRLGLPDDLAAMVAQHRGWVAGEVLAERIVDEDGWTSTDELDGRGIFVAVDRIP